MKIKKAVLLVLISILFNLRAAAVAGLCDSVADIQAKQESVKKQLDQNSNELSGKMDEINQVYQKLSDLEGKKKETEQRITQTQTKLQQAQQEKRIASEMPRNVFANFKSAKEPIRVFRFLRNRQA